jgi:arginine/ornithine transport system substrate-binding protein
MKNVTKLLAGLCLFVGLASAQAADWKKIRIGVEGAYPPFSQMTSDGKLIGFDIDIANALCDEIGAKCDLVAQDWDGIIPALMARKYDAIIASMSITEERKKVVSFSKKYYNTPAMFAAPKSMNIEVTKSGLKGKTVGVQRATTHDSFITDTFGDAVNVKRYATQDEAYLDAVSGRIDLLFADSVAMTDGFIETDQGKGFQLIGRGYSEPKYFGEGVGVAVRKKDQDLADLFTKAIATIRSNGVYEKINAKYFAFDVFGK